MRSFSFVVLLLAAVPAPAQYAGVPGTGGPAVLSRRGVLGAGATDRTTLATIRPFLEASGTWTSGFSPMSTDAGQTEQDGSYGAAITAGVNGFHTWRSTMLGINYLARGHYYSRYRESFTIDQVISLGFAHQVNRRTTISFNQTAGSFSRGWGLLNPGVYMDSAFPTVPTDEIFDTRVSFLSSVAEATHRASARWSVSFAGSGSIVRRSGISAGGLNAFGGQAEAVYSLGRRQSIGFGYVFQHYGFSKQFGASDVHGAEMSYSTQIGRHWRFGLGGGGYRVESLFARRVQLDPVVAAILGQASGIEAFYGMNYGASGRASLSRQLRRGSFAINANQRISPGNGYYLTSRQQSGGASYSYSGLRRAGVGVSVQYTAMTSLTSTLRRYEGVSGSIHAGYRLTGALHVSTGFSRMHSISGSAGFKRDAYAAQVGLSFAPGSLPISLW